MHNSGLKAVCPPLPVFHLWHVIMKLHRLPMHPLLPAVSLFILHNRSLLINLPTGAADAAGISNLRIGKYNGTSNNGTGLPGSYTNGSSIIDPVDSDIVWNATLSRWEVSFNVTGFSGFIVQTVSSTLPVTLLEFQAQRKAQTTLLTWSTASEQNNKGFTIQRSTNGRNFTDLGFVPAATNGNSAVTQNYNFTDAAPLIGRNYYRLLQQDDNGRSKSSEIRIVDFSDKMVIAMYPNPATSVLNISISSISNESLQLRITDVTGRVLKTRNYNNASGTIQLNIDDLAKGTYFLELWMNNEKQVYSFIKQ
jgi:trimeric autotransporter adhesin